MIGCFLMFVFSAVIVAGLVLNNVGHARLFCFVWVGCGLVLMCCCFICCLLWWFDAVLYLCFCFLFGAGFFDSVGYGWGALIFLWLI